MKKGHTINYFVADFLPTFATENAGVIVCEWGETQRYGCSKGFVCRCTLKPSRCLVWMVVLRSSSPYPSYGKADLLRVVNREEAHRDFLLRGD